MMDANDERDRLDGWRIDRCDHGCVHLHLERTTLSFTAEEFGALRRLIEYAAAQWSIDPAPLVRFLPH